MNLKKWLDKSNLTQIQFASKLGISRTHLHHILTSNRIPSRNLAIQIEIQTNGLVSAEEVIFPNKIKTAKIPKKTKVTKETEKILQKRKDEYDENIKNNMKEYLNQVDMESSGLNSL